MSRTGAIACGHAETARAAADVLEDGGNAFDAALAALCASVVTEPVLASLGGGGFLLARPAEGRGAGTSIVFDFFAQTPREREAGRDIQFSPVFADFGDVQQEFHIGKGSIATPGLVRGLFEIHRDLGFMPLRRIVEPAVRLAREGVRVAPMQAFMLKVVGAIIRSDPACFALHQSDQRPGELAEEGDILCNPRLADTLETLAIEGDDLFYRGEIARAIADDCMAGGGYLTAADLETYRVERRRPLALPMFGAQLEFNPPPSTGGILVAFALELLREVDPETLAFGTSEWIRMLARVMDLTNRARIDKRLHEIEAGDAVDALLDAALVAAYRSDVMGRPASTRGTTHISVIDASGNAAALSVSNGEGSGYVVPDTGIHMNNMLGEEDINPHGFHSWPPNRRMSSMMTPTVAVDRTGGVLALGSGGSNRIRTAVLQVLLNRLAMKASLEDSVVRPRIHFEHDRLNIEAGFSEAAVGAGREVASERVEWSRTSMYFGGVHAVFRSGSGDLEGAGDPRRGGVARVV